MHTLQKHVLFTVRLHQDRRPVLMSPSYHCKSTVSLSLSRVANTLTIAAEQLKGHVVIQCAVVLFHTRACNRNGQMGADKELFSGY